MHRLPTSAKHLLLSASLLASFASATGCRVSADKNSDNDNVKIATPFGNLQVKTNDNAQTASTGLPVYPGAAPVKKEGNNDGAADVNMSFGSFRLHVKALSFRTADAPDKVQAFYSKALARYGDVLTCDGNRPVGTPTRTSEGLLCSSKKSVGVTVEADDDHKLELKTGSEQHQHIVSIEHEGSGTKFGLVALDLPGHISLSTDDSTESKQ